MKTTLYFLTIIVLLVTCVPSSGQGFIGKTNEVLIDNKKPVFSPLPVIAWTLPQLESSFSQDAKLVLEAEVRSDINLKQVRLEVKAGGETRVRQLELSNNNYMKISQPVSLSDGENVLELIAVNEKGAEVKSTRSIIIGKDDIMTRLNANRKDYALIFATDKYENFDQLVNPIDDSKTIKTLLEEKYLFKTEIVENPTYEEILAKIYDYNTRKFNPQDQLFIFFAGHGLFDDVLGEGYIVATNSLANDKGKASYIPHTTLRNNIENIKCEHIFLAMDVCFGGTFDPTLARTRDASAYTEASDAEIMMRKLSKRTRKFLTSGSKQYVSDGVAGKHSPFAARFIEALRTVGDGKDRLLTITELQPYFLKLATEPRSGGFGTDENGSDFVFVAKQ